MIWYVSLRVVVVCCVVMHVGVLCYVVLCDVVCCRDVFRVVMYCCVWLYVVVV